MNVSELIKFLETQPKDARVRINTGCNESYNMDPCVENSYFVVDKNTLYINGGE